MRRHDPHHAHRFCAPLPRDRRRAVWPGDPRPDGEFSPPGGAHQGPWPVSGGGQRASRTGGADGSAIGPASGDQRAGGWRFDQPVAPNGYRWWYVDGLSDDGAHAITVIAFIGSVFSPYYAISRRAGPADPATHVAFNLALYGVGGPGWAMTERNAQALRQTPNRLAIGPSAMEWRDQALVITIDERTAPIPRRLLGTITLHPTAIHADSVAIDAEGRHRWTPLAPCARIEVAFTAPEWRWSGHAYADSNDGDAPLEQDFHQWQWSRALMPDGSTVVLYDAARRDGSSFQCAERFHPDGRRTTLAMPPRRPLPAGLWRMRPVTHGDAPPRLLRRLEDSPFYTRSVVATRLLETDVTAIHESLSLDRFRKPWVQALLPFRMPR